MLCKEEGGKIYNVVFQIFFNLPCQILLLPLFLLILCFWLNVKVSHFYFLIQSLPTDIIYLYVLKNQWKLFYICRAGRCRPGICFHFFSRLRFNNMLEFQIPQLLRMPLQVLALSNSLKKQHIESKSLLRKKTPGTQVTWVVVVGALPGQAQPEAGTWVRLPVGPASTGMTMGKSWNVGWMSSIRVCPVSTIGESSWGVPVSSGLIH